MLHTAIANFANRLGSLLSGYTPSIFLYGSVALDDFHYGWSDIDVLCLTSSSLAAEHARALVDLRQELSSEYSDTLYLLFEGACLSTDALLKHTEEPIIYWGTSGQWLVDTYNCNSFSRYELKTTGKLLYGMDIRPLIPMPMYTDLKQDVVRHYRIIRKYAHMTEAGVYSCGWMLDIARCLYTLRTGQVIAKTAAGKWALENQLCTVPETLQKAIEVRQNPQAYIRSPEFLAWSSQLENDVQAFADVLEREIG